jgi:hypothetical protein
MRRVMSWKNISKRGQAQGHVPLFGKGGAAEPKHRTGADSRSIAKNDPDYKSMDKKKNKKEARDKKRYR